MARPEKDAAEKRDIVIRVRLTRPEKKHLLNAAEIEGLTLSDFLRLRALSTLPRRRKPSVERAAFILGLAELGKIGSNVNQIARALNRRDIGATGSEVSPELVNHALHGVDTLSHHLLSLLEHGH